MASPHEEQGETITTVCGISTTTSEEPTRRKKKNRSARTAASVKRSLTEMMRVQIARGIDDDMYEDVENLINGLNTEPDGPVMPPVAEESEDEERSGQGGLVNSDDEEYRDVTRRRREDVWEAARRCIENPDAGDIEELKNEEDEHGAQEERAHSDNARAHSPTQPHSDNAPAHSADNARAQR